MRVYCFALFQKIRKIENLVLHQGTESSKHRQCASASSSHRTLRSQRLQHLQDQRAVLETWELPKIFPETRVSERGFVAQKFPTRRLKAGEKWRCSATSK